MRRLDETKCSTASRSAYVNAGCRCVECRIASATAKARQRRLKVLGKVSWGARIPAGETFRRVRALAGEYGSHAALARALGFQNGHVQCRGLRITVRNYWKILKLYRDALGE